MLRLLIKLASGLIVLAIIVPILFVYVAPGQVVTYMANRIEESTGRKVSVDGQVRPSFYPVLGLQLGRVELANAPWSTEPVMMSADRLEVGIELRGLFRGEFEISGVRLIDPVIRLEMSPDGRANWDFEPVRPLEALGPSSADEVEEEKSRTEIRLHDARVVNAQVEYVDGVSGRNYRVEGMNATLVMPGPRRPVDLTGTARLNDGNLQFAAVIQTMDDLLSGNAVEVASKVRMPGHFNASFDGVVDLGPRKVTGTVSMSSPDLSQLRSLMDDDLASEDESVPVRVHGAIAFEPGQPIVLSDAAIQLGRNNLTGRVEYMSGDRPRILAELNSDVIRLEESLSSTENDGNEFDAVLGQNPDGFGIPDFGELEVELSLSANAVDLGSILTGAVDIDANLSNRVVAITLNRVSIFGGVLSGRTALSDRKTLTVVADLAVRSVRTDRILAPFLDKRRLTGKLDGDFRVRASGTSVDDVLASLAGNATVRISDAVVHGVDIDRLKDLLASASDRQAFDINSASASFSSTQGVLDTNDLAVDGKDFDATGTGQVDLPRRRIDLDLMLDVEGLNIPVGIEGHWDDLSVRIDFDRVPGLSEAKDRIGREILGEVLEQTIGTAGVVTDSDGSNGEADEKSVHDVVGDAVQDRLERGLDSLFKDILGE